MPINAPSFRLRRMVLINVGTNKNKPSGRITAIDPRGGAAVLGENGVGKTTTLRLLPLFFGHLHSAIVDPQKGQQNMVRFVLPTDMSAIAFEYQRGSDAESDLRLAVIRRRIDDPDSLCYRIFRCGYRKELFVHEGRFLSEEETQKAAIDLKIQTFKRLSPSDYRHVILGTPAETKEKALLRSLSQDFSFGPRPLANLDRVVAAMVKKHVSFSDIVQVAVSLAQSELGAGGTRAVLSYKQGKGQIEQWIRTRQACKDALALEPKVVALQESLGAYRNLETLIRACRGDIEAMHLLRRQEIEKLAAQIHQAQLDRDSLLATEQEQLGILQGNVASASEAATQTRTAFQEQSDQLKYFNQHEAAKYELKLLSLGQLQSDLQIKNGQLEALKAAHADLMSRTNELALEAKALASKDKLRLELDKKPLDERLARGLENLVTLEKNQVAELDAEINALRTEFTIAKEPLLAERGTWDAKRSAPAASEEALAALTATNETLRVHQNEIAAGQDALSTLATQKHQAIQAFGAQEVVVHQALQQLNQVRQDLAQAQQLLTPADGTLLSALRASEDQSWKRNLARVVDPRLLANTDLEPILTEEGSPTFYGWQLKTSTLTAPDWSNDESAKKAVEELQVASARAEASWKAHKEELVRLETARRAAEAAHQAADGVLTAKRSRTAEISGRQEDAKERVQRERSDSKGKAEAEFTRLTAEIKEIERRTGGLDGDRDLRVREIDSAISESRKALRAEHMAGIDEIDRAIARVDANLAAALQEMEEQLQERLRGDEVDVEKLNALSTEVSNLRSEIEELQSKEILVNKWRAWQKEVGSAGLERLEAIANQKERSLTAASSALNGHNWTMQRTSQEFFQAKQGLESRQNTAQTDLNKLDAALVSCGDYSAIRDSEVTTTASAEELHRRAHELSQQILASSSKISKEVANLRQQLVAKPSPVRDLIESLLDPIDSKDFYKLAYELGVAYRQIGPQIVSNMNVTLKSLLDNISSFHKSLLSFEREISAFNRRLQAGLSEVQCFERVSDLHLDITTNFDTMGRFYRSLSTMGNLAREVSDATQGVDTTRHLPSDDVERALKDFANELRADGLFEVSLAKHITLRGRVMDNGRLKEFAKAEELEGISSEGLTSLILITLMTALLNTIRGNEPVHVPWVTDEVGKFDSSNFRVLMERLQDNRIDVVTASPELGPAQQVLFAQRYLFEDLGRICVYMPDPTLASKTPGASASPSLTGSAPEDADMVIPARPPTTEERA